MSLVSLAKKTKIGQDVNDLNNRIMSDIYALADSFNKFNDILEEVKSNVDFTEDEKKEISDSILECYRILMYAAIGAHNMEGITGVPIVLWDSVGFDVRPLLAAVGKYTYSSTSSSSSSSSSNEV